MRWRFLVASSRNCVNFLIQQVSFNPDVKKKIFFSYFPLLYINTERSSRLKMVITFLKRSDLTEDEQTTIR